MSPTHTLIECQTAADLLDALSPRSMHFASSEPRTWIFRGQRLNSKPLVPTALRPELRDTVARLAGPVDLDRGDASVQQIAKEKRIARRFFEAVDEAGLLPTLNWDEVRRFLLDEPSTLYGVPPSLWPFFALAQHYGLPTRLLDWTRSPRYGAFFAAQSSVRKSLTARTIEVSGEPNREDSDDGKLVVWALHASKIEALARSPGLSLLDQFSAITLITAPRAGNPNLHAQEGLFTLHMPSGVAEDIPDGTPIDTVLMRVSDELGDRFEWTESDLLRFTLPRTEARPLMKLLAAEGVTAAKLFPGFLGAAQAVIDQQYWPNE